MRPAATSFQQSSGKSPLPDLGAAPEFADLGPWINSPPLRLAELRGKVVLVDFWTLGCASCVETLPTLSRWHKKYASQGLLIVGVHAPEFSHERDPANVRTAIEKNEILYPVAIDNSFATWKAYENRFWPAFYFIDARGRVRHAHFGDGSYEKNERIIRTLLAEAAAS